MKHLLLSSLLSFFYLAGNAQNLVPNSSFEDTLNCSVYFSRIDVAHPWFSAQGTPDLCTIHSSCSNCPSTGPQSFQEARTGNAYAGIYFYQTSPNFCVREYMEVELLQPLDSGVNYCVGWYQSRSEAFQHAVGTFGVVLTSDSLIGAETEICNIQIEPYIEWLDSIDTNSSEWVHVYGEFESNGTERFLTIGNFRDDENSAVEFVGGQNFGGYYYIDDVYLEMCESPNSVIEESLRSITLYPNPSYDILNINSNNPIKGSLQVIRSDGHVVLELANGGQSLDVSSLSAGVYLLRINIDGVTTVKRFVIQ